MNLGAAEEFAERKMDGRYVTNLKFVPETKQGRRSIGCLGVFATMFLYAQIMVFSGQPGGNTLFDNVAISVPMIVGMISILIGAGFGLVSIFKEDERAIPVFATCFIGLAVCLFLIGDLVSAH